MSDQFYQDHRLHGRVVRTGLRILQVAFAVAVIVLYAIDLDTSTQHHARADSSWVFAEAVAGLSILTCGIYSFLTVKHVLWCIWASVLFVLWVTTFGRFASLYLSAVNASLNEPLTTSVPRMKAALWLDLVNTLLWLAELTLAIVYCCGSARKVSLKSDEAVVSEGDEECGELTGSRHIMDVHETSWFVANARMQNNLGYEKGGEGDDNVAWDSGSSRPPSYISELPVIEEDIVPEWKF